ncbi:helix-turn-helix domain-containing protein (plasmid) [Streptosporangium sandarakinum]|uniref:helix-turn-helix domain-containing protein n=1 Tax=Streptosporangium sandarakinum TaxID=1260955 RepID=UPI003D93F5CE
MNDSSRRPVDRQLVRRLYVEEKLTVRQVAAKVGVSHTRVHRLLTRMGVQLRPRGTTRRQIPGEKRAAILAEYRAGTPIEEIVENQRVASTTVMRVAEEAGEPRRPRGGRRVLDWDVIEGLYLKGWPADAIALLVDASESHIRAVLRNLGYGRPPLPDVKTLAQLYAELGSLRKVARQVRSSAKRVQTVLEGAGVPVKHRRRRVDLAA